MKITVRWTNRNAAADGHRIYKSETPIDPNALPAVHQTVAAETTEWVDTEVVRGTRYYYRVGTFQGDDFALSTEMTVEAIPYTGPGPANLLHGDYENGYFGIIEAYDLVSGPELKSLVEHDMTAGDPAQKWVKVAHKGKILFIPMGIEFGKHSWLEAYKNGLVYGTDNNGPAEAVTANDEVGVNQLKTFSKFGSTFKVRLLKGLPDDLEGMTWDGTSVEEPRGVEHSEFNQTVTRVAYGLYSKGTGVVLDDVNVGSLTHTTTSNATTMCQELIDGKYVYRGLRHGNENVMGNGATVAVNSETVVWRPILELIEN